MNPESRIGIGAAGITAVAALALGVERGAAAGIAVAMGGGLSLLNYSWLRAGARALLPAQGEVIPRDVRSGAVRFLTRFGLLGACLYAIFISRLLPLGPVIGGLFAVPAAALAEGLRLLWNNSGLPTS